MKICIEMGKEGFFLIEISYISLLQKNAAIG
jgi:hypothetical protein